MSRGQITERTIKIVTEECCACGVIFGLEKNHRDTLVDNGAWFYCPNGHSQHYTGPSEATKLKERLRQQEQEAASRQAALERRLEAERVARTAVDDQLQATRRSKAALKGQLTKTKRRIGKGVCPCCNRHFPNLEGHMTTEHPEFTQEMTP